MCKTNLRPYFSTFQNPHTVLMPRAVSLNLVRGGLNFLKVPCNWEPKMRVCEAETTKMPYYVCLGSVG